MAMIVNGCDCVYQHPEDRVRWSVSGVPEPRLVSVRRVRPKGDAKELTVTVERGELMVFGGYNGARYEITLQDGLFFQIRFTSKGVETVTTEGERAVATVIKKIERGKVIVPVGVTYQARDIHG